MPYGKKVICEVSNLKKHFNLGRKKILKAVDGVSFKIKEGDTLGLVGESGCGKSTLGKTVIRLYDATEGTIIFDGKDISTLRGSELSAISDNIQMIFQDPYSCLDPRMTVGEIIAEGWDIRRVYKKHERHKKHEKIVELLELVGLCEEHACRFPHEFSGGQRQRIGIARALSMKPKFIICDEPISALDVSIQAQIMNLLIRLQKHFGLTYLFIAHDLSMVKHISDNIAVMYLGHIMEYAGSREIYEKPFHPYTQALFSAIPVPDPGKERNRQQIILEGDLSSPINPAPGCRFAPRCSVAKNVCTQEMPQLAEISPGHFVSCHFLNTEIKGGNGNFPNKDIVDF